eukprot:Gb_18691 [translate_table: standard]
MVETKRIDLQGDPKSGFCKANGIYYSKRNPVILPPVDEVLDLPTYVFSQPRHGQIAFIDAPTASRLSYHDLRQKVKAVAAGLHALGIRKRRRCAGCVAQCHYDSMHLLGHSLHWNSSYHFQSNISCCKMPMIHVYGFLYTMKSLAIGGTMVVMPKFDLEEMLWAIQKYKVTDLPASPPNLVALVKSGITNKYDLSSLRQIGSGIAPLGKDVIEEFTGRFPAVEVRQGLQLVCALTSLVLGITQAYGLTESSGVITLTKTSEEIKRYGTAGLLNANVEAKVVDIISGKALPPNHRGELWVRSPTIMKGEPCYIDEGGFLFVVDRLKELIKYKAFQVAPAELEELLLSHIEISDAAVIPAIGTLPTLLTPLFSYSLGPRRYPDDNAGQIPMAYIVRKLHSKRSEQDVMDFVARQVSPYKKIRRVASVTSIPESPSGKI